MLKNFYGYMINTDKLDFVAPFDITEQAITLQINGTHLNIHVSPDTSELTKSGQFKDAVGGGSKDMLTMGSLFYKNVMDSIDTLKN